MNIDFNEITETAEERLAEAFSQKSKFSVAKGRTGIRYIVVSTDVTKGLAEEFWYNLDPLDSDAVCPRLRFGVKINDAGRFYIFKDEKFGALERPREKSADWWRRFTSKDCVWMERQIRDWLSSSAGQDFIAKNKLEGCLCIKNLMEIRRG